mmetsp:Transcript_21525/g.47316  ORF Transcript_21525/g.47316 Transcript_21525/m.47316 type:complete len:82 (+) Transcript_21525:523-768(+)
MFQSLRQLWNTSGKVIRLQHAGAESEVVSMVSFLDEALKSCSLSVILGVGHSQQQRLFSCRATVNLMRLLLFRGSQNCWEL